MTRLVTESKLALHKRGANKPKGGGVQVRDMPLFGKPADQDGRLLSQNNLLGGACMPGSFRNQRWGR